MEETATLQVQRPHENPKRKIKAKNEVRDSPYFLFIWTAHPDTRFLSFFGTLNSRRPLGAVQNTSAAAAAAASVSLSNVDWEKLK